MLYLLLFNWILSEIYLYFLCLQVSNELQLESHNRCQELDLIAWKLTTSSLFTTPLHHSQLGSTQANHFALFFNDRPPIYSPNPCRNLFSGVMFTTSLNLARDRKTKSVLYISISDVYGLYVIL